MQQCNITSRLLSKSLPDPSHTRLNDIINLHLIYILFYYIQFINI